MPDVDKEKYQPWHVIADPQSRNWHLNFQFTFRHRIACCRNLIAALISADRLNLLSPLLTNRIIYVGPDTSVRLFCIPGLEADNQNEQTSCKRKELFIILFSMLMDGYHPFHAVGCGAVQTRSPERRMKAGLYPWNGINPDIRPPQKAPDYQILPVDLRNLFENELLHTPIEEENDLTSHSLTRCFTLFDTITTEIICCVENADHWYLPGFSGCPWCVSAGRKKPCVSCTLLLAAPTHKTLLLTENRVAGYLKMPKRFVRQQATPRVLISRWATIPLPCERFIRMLLPLQKPRYMLPLQSSRPILLTPWKRSWLVIYPQNVVEPIISETKEGFYETISISITIDSDCLHCDMSLIDEMIWTSTMDRLKGEGIGLPKRKRIPLKPATRRRQPVQIMIPPMYLPWPKDAKDDMSGNKEIATKEVNKAKKKGPGKGIRGKLKTLLRDLVG
jgi:hypothetical protein